jgi:hypothetical protein
MYGIDAFKKRFSKEECYIADEYDFEPNPVLKQVSLLTGRGLREAARISRAVRRRNSPRCHEQTIAIAHPVA